MRSLLLHCTTWLALGLATLVHAAPADFAGQQPSQDAREVADWVMEAQDNAGLPFALVDKRAARLYLFDAQGRLQAVSAALLGLAQGDHGDPQLNQRDLATLAPHERTTPAGRFNAQPGRNLQGEHVVWVDYGAALAIHRLRPTAARERRAARLASATPDDNRISLGCVVVPAQFYDDAVAPLLGKGRSVVYILPETRPARDMFGWQ